jgi:glutamine synthetase type III
MTSSVPSLKTLAAHAASTQPVNVLLPDDLITYLENYVDLRIVLETTPGVAEDLQVLGAKMASVETFTAELREEFINEANGLVGRIDNALALFDGAFAAVDQETDAEWRDYYTQLLSVAMQELHQLRDQLAIIPAQLTELPDSDDDDL